jgi:hypothetical protein
MKIMVEMGGFKYPNIKRISDPVSAPRLTTTTMAREFFGPPPVKISLARHFFPSGHVLIKGEVSV